MEQSSAVGYMKDAEEVLICDICIAWMHSYKYRLFNSSVLWIELDGTIDLKNKHAKKNYYQCLSLAYNSFGMKKVFKNYVYPVNSVENLPSVKRSSWKSGRLYVSAKIPFVLFLMLITIIRYSGEKLKQLETFNRFKADMQTANRKKLTYKQQAKLFVLCDMFDFRDGMLMRNFSSGHSLNDMRQLGKDAQNLRYIGSIHRRINKYIKKHGIQDAINGGYFTSDSLHRLVIPRERDGAVNVSLESTGKIFSKFQEIMNND